MISQVLKSIAKSIRLRKISKAIVARPLSDEPLERLLDLCEGNQTTQFVMRSHGADRETIRALYISLVANGASNTPRPTTSYRMITANSTNQPAANAFSARVRRSVRLNVS